MMMRVGAEVAEVASRFCHRSTGESSRRKTRRAQPGVKRRASLQYISLPARYYWAIPTLVSTTNSLRRQSLPWQRRDERRAWQAGSHVSLQLLARHCHKICKSATGCRGPSQGLTTSFVKRSSSAARPDRQRLKPDGEDETNQTQEDRGKEVSLGLP